MVLSASAVPMLITAGVTPTVMQGDNNSQAQINALIAPIVGGDFLYKGVPNGTEEGSFKESYSTLWNLSDLTPESFAIRYDGGFSFTPSYLLVKDGNASPNWYLYDVQGWNFTIYGRGFFPNQGSISHVSVYGRTCPKPPENQVPDGGATATLLGLACAGMAIAKRRTRS